MEADRKPSIQTVFGVSLLAFFIMFRYLLGNNYFIVLFGIAALLIMNGKLKMSFDESDLFWIFYILIVFSFGLLRDNKGIAIRRFMFFLADLLIKILLQTEQKKWCDRFFNLLLAMGFIHAVGILVEVINPYIIYTFRRTFNIFQLERFSLVYRSGITNQPGVAGFCISVFTCISVASVIKADRKRYKLYLLLSLLGLSTLLLTGKRALFGEVMFCCFVTVYLYYAVILRKGVKLFSLLLILLIILPFAARLPVFSANVDRLLYGDDAGRFYIWSYLINNFRSSPLVGVGRDVFAEQLDIGAHNDYLRVLSENGLLGFVFFFPALMIPLIKMLAVIIQYRDYLKVMLNTQQKSIVFELLASVFWQITILLYALTGNPLKQIEQFSSYMAFTAIGLNAIKKIKLSAHGREYETLADVPLENQI